MTLLHHVFVVNINHEVLKRWGYKKRPEGEKKKVSYSMHIFNISAINRHFFPEVAPTVFCGRDCIETHM